MPFLPADYQLPTATSSYMKLQPGSNRFRIMGSFSDKPPSAIMGWLAWSEKDGKRMPCRFPMADKPPVGSFPEEPKHMWAMTVVNFTNAEEPQFQILELVQKSILDELTKLFNDADWGNPCGTAGYDIDIFRIGEGKDTKYTTNPKPRTPLTGEQLALARPVNLDALYLGEDPFEFELTAEAPQPIQPDF